MATSGRSVSGRAVPTAASTLPTAPSDSPRFAPIHSTPLVNSSAENRITTSATPSSIHSKRAILSLGRDGQDAGGHCPIRMVRQRAREFSQKGTRLGSGGGQQGVRRPPRRSRRERGLAGTRGVLGGTGSDSGTVP